MVKLKTVLDMRRTKSDGTYPIVIRITNHKEVKYYTIGFSAFKKQWDKSTSTLNKHHPNATSLNALISKRYFEIQKAILRLEDADGYSYEGLKSELEVKPESVSKKTTFVEFSQQIIDEMLEVKRTGNAIVYRLAVNRLIGYCKNPNIKFKDIDYTFLDKFRNTLLKEGMKKNTIGNYFRSIRALYNKAIKAKIVSRDSYPFHDISIKTEKTAKRALSIDDVTKIYRQAKEHGSQEWHAANYFFLSFALRGVSFIDLAYLKPENIDKEYITYRRRKTQKHYKIKLHPISQSILKHYSDNTNGYLLPVFPKGIEEDSVRAFKISQQWIKTTNKYLKRTAEKCNVDSHITTYVARHTWATTAKRLGYANEMIAEAMGHEYGNKITNIYLADFDQSLIDNMNDKVLLKVIPCLLQVVNTGQFAMKINISKFKKQQLFIA